MFDNYVVLENDTFDSIANKYNTTDDVLKKINGSKLIPGMTLLIPKINSNYFDYYLVSSGDTLYKIAKDNNINSRLLAILNGINENDYIYPNQEILIPKNNYSYYVTAEGDTIKTVSDKFGMKEDELLTYNQTIYLLPGQLLFHKK